MQLNFKMPANNSVWGIGGAFLWPVLAACFLTVSTGAYAGLQEGLNAYQSGDYAAALKEFRTLAGKGDATAQYHIGVMNELGQGVPQDYQKAATQYGYAAEGGNAEAQYHLGVLNDLGKGVAQNYKLAADWYRKAADQGHAEAKKNLAAVLEVKATRLKQGLAAYKSGDYTAALKELAPLEYDDATAQLHLGIMNELGNGVPKDESKARELYYKAATQGDAEAQYRIGVMLDLGKGVPQNKVAAADWFKKSAAQGYAKALEQLKPAAEPKPVAEAKPAAEPGPAAEPKPEAAVKISPRHAPIAPDGPA